MKPDNDISSKSVYAVDACARLLEIQYIRYNCRTVWNCSQTLGRLAEDNTISLVCVPLNTVQKWNPSRSVCNAKIGRASHWARTSARHLQELNNVLDRKGEASEPSKHTGFTSLKSANTWFFEDISGIIKTLVALLTDHRSLPTERIRKHDLFRSIYLDSFMKVFSWFPLWMVFSIIEYTVP